MTRPDFVRSNLSEAEVDALRCRIAELQALINNPHNEDFLAGVRLEAAHQIERWGTDHDVAKAPPDWFWLLGYLAGKALAAATSGDRDKALHHTISSAAVLLNWHAALLGVDRRMQPGSAAVQQAEGE